MVVVSARPHPDSDSAGAAIPAAPVEGETEGETVDLRHRPHHHGMAAAIIFLLRSTS